MGRNKHLNGQEKTEVMGAAAVMDGHDVVTFISLRDSTNNFIKELK